MKTLFTLLKRATSPAAIAAACALTISSAPQRADALLRRGPLLSEAENEGASGGGSAGTRTLKIQVVEPDFARKEVAWLGVSTEEAPDALSAQLGLQAGDGLVVLFVQADRPAAKAGLKKNDVLVQLGDQLLVHPGQFRKLVRRQKEGDKIKFKDLHQSVAYAGPTKQFVEVEVQHRINEARQALHDALTRNHTFAMALGSEATNVEALAKSEAELGCNATVTVKKNAKSVKTMVKTDETATYVIVANPKKRLTVHDKKGNLLFDGAIETKDQQHEVPPELWPKAQLMLKEMGRVTEDEPGPKP